MKTYNRYFLSITLWLAVITFNNLAAQNKYLDKSGVITFEASEKLFEEVKATNSTVTAIYNEDTKQIASLALVKGFRFKNSLMEEHFNENYIESHLYPKATFKGVLQDFKGDLGVETKEVAVIGSLKLHGKEKEIETVLKLQKVNDVISITGEFIVAPSDFDIEIPKLVENKIAKEVHITISFKLHKK